MAEPKLIKVCLTNKGEDTETPWAHDLGPGPGPAGSRKVKLVNVPFMHAKPTWGDTIVVSPATEGYPTWDRNGVKWQEISSRIVEDGGRWAMIVDYAPHDGVSGTDAFAELTKACDPERLVCEGAWGPREGEPGRVYLAVPRDVTAETVMEKLQAVTLPLTLTQIHPLPKRTSRAQTVVGVVPHTPRTPAARAKTVDEQLEQVSKPARSKTEKPAKAAPAAKAKAKAAPAPAKKAAPAAKAKAAPAKKPAPPAKKAPMPAAKKPAAQKPAAKKPAKKK